MREVIEFDATLMFQDRLISDIHFTLLGDDLFSNVKREYNKELLPPILFDRYSNIGLWLRSRMMPFNNGHYINFIPLPLGQFGERTPYAQMILSLNTNAASLYDFYWLNVKEPVSFKYKTRQINLIPKTWEEIGFDVDDSELKRFNDLVFCDQHSKIPEKQLDLINPIFVTNGEEKKRWNFENNTWLLEKRKPKELLEKEINGFRFFRDNGFLTPNCELQHYDVQKDYTIYRPDTIENGFDTIVKSCLTDKTKMLIPMAWFLTEKCYGLGDAIKLAYETLQNITVLQEYMMKAIEEYLQLVDFESISVSNFGFLYDGKSATPAVWSDVVKHKIENSWHHPNVDAQNSFFDPI